MSVPFPHRAATAAVACALLIGCSSGGDDGATSGADRSSELLSRNVVANDDAFTLISAVVIRERVMVELAFANDGYPPRSLCWTLLRTVEPDPAIVGYLTEHSIQEEALQDRIFVPEANPGPPACPEVRSFAPTTYLSWPADLMTTQGDEVLCHGFVEAPRDNGPCVPIVQAQ